MIGDKIDGASDAVQGFWDDTASSVQEGTEDIHEVLTDFGEQVGEGLDRYRQMTNGVVAKLRLPCFGEDCEETTTTTEINN